MLFHLALFLCFESDICAHVLFLLLVLVRLFFLSFVHVQGPMGPEGEQGPVGEPGIKVRKKPDVKL